MGIANIGIMSNNIIPAVKQFLYKKSPDNGINTNSPDTALQIDLHRGKRAKRTIDANLTSQNYHRTKDVQAELLMHYETVDWYERNPQFDFSYFEDRA